MQRKSSTTSAIVTGKCPRCHEGNIFKYPAFHPARFAKMHDHCPVCDLNYEREPGFYFGAMYVSYGFSVAIFIAVGVLLSAIGSFALTTYLITTTVVVTILLPFLFRYSRILFLHMFGGVRFDPRHDQ